MEPCDFVEVYNLVHDYLKYVCLEDSQIEAATSKVAQVLQAVTFPFQEEIENNLRPVLDAIEIDCIAGAKGLFSQVMEKTFADERVNWGRILTIFIFGGILAKKLQAQGVPPLTSENMEQISHFMTDYIINTKAKWITENGGWVSFRRDPFFSASFWY